MPTSLETNKLTIFQNHGLSGDHQVVSLEVGTVLVLCYFFIGRIGIHFLLNFLCSFFEFR